MIGRVFIINNIATWWLVLMGLVVTIPPYIVEKQNKKTNKKYEKNNYRDDVVADSIVIKR